LEAPAVRRPLILDAPGVSAVTQFVYKNKSWVNLDGEVGNPAESI
jgi:hypothetical protein